MTIGSFLDQATHTLKTAGIESARLDVLLFLEDALGKDRAYLLAHAEAKIDPKTEVELNNKIVQRTENKPLAYIRGHAPFYGREFLVSPAVLVPRPETEAIIGLAKKLDLPVNPTIVDVGTGSGCLGITLALELPTHRVYLYDIDDGALDIARQNAKKHRIEATSKQRHVLSQAPQQIDLVVANLPYVPVGLPINKAATFEPQQALFSGADGLELYREFWQQLAVRRPQHVITEAFPNQHIKLEKLAKNAGYELTATDGFAQSFSLSAQHQG